jgi:hypothetical protein
VDGVDREAYALHVASPPESLSTALLLWPCVTHLTLLAEQRRRSAHCYNDGALASPDEPHRA